MAELSKADLDELVEEAIVDAYGEDEQLTGFYTMLEENLVLPFTTMVLGVEVTVESIDLTDCGITAICVRGVHLCVPITSSTSCHQAIFVDQATDPSLSSDAVQVETDRLG